MSVHLFVFGSYIERWRGDSFSGATLDDGCEPSLQYADCPFGSEAEDGVSGSRHGCWICVATCFTGSSTGTMSVLSSGEPYILPLALTVGLSLSVEIESCR